MYVSAFSKELFFREKPRLLFPSPLTTSDVPMAVDVPADEPRYVSSPVEQQPNERLGKSKKKLKQTRRGRGGKKG